MEQDRTEPQITRRRLLQLGLALPLAAVMARGSSLLDAAGVGAAPLRATPSCDGFHQTPAETEGPYFKPGSPLRRSLVEPGMAGTRLTLTGYVFTTRCKPVPHALLDFWHADSRGVYDNQGYRLRGHQFTDAKGRFRLETIVPGLYPDRTRHIHVKVQAPGRSVLTTQLYFPSESSNQSDPLFNHNLLVRWRKIGTRRVAHFDFVLALS